MLEVDDEIEHEDRQQDRQPAWHGKDVQQPPAALFGHQRQSDGENRKGQPQDRGIDRDEGEVVGPADDARDLPAAARRGNLPQGHDRQNAKEGGKPQRRFGGKKGFGHRTSLQVFSLCRQGHAGNTAQVLPCGDTCNLQLWLPD